MSLHTHTHAHTHKISGEIALKYRNSQKLIDQLTAAATTIIIRKINDNDEDNINSKINDNDEDNINSKINDNDEDNINSKTLIMMKII